MKEINKDSIKGVCSSICYAYKIKPPKKSNRKNKDLCKSIDLFFNKEKVDRVVMYNPDAIAEWIYFKYANLFKDLKEEIDIEIPLQTVMPSVTPVCFASMYTGVDPKTHGIFEYKKPILQIETLFDVLIKNNLKPVIIAEKNSSIAMIFLNRNMDYFIYDTIEEVNRKAIELIKEDKYDFYCIYNGNYDDEMHKHSPEGKEAIDALIENINTFDLINNTIKENWNHNTLLGFAMDHGCHYIDNNMGSHGLYTKEDINIRHLYKFYKKK